MSSQKHTSEHTLTKPVGARPTWSSSTRMGLQGQPHDVVRQSDARKRANNSNDPELCLQHSLQFVLQLVTMMDAYVAHQSYNYRYQYRTLCFLWGRLSSRSIATVLVEPRPCAVAYCASLCSHRCRNPMFARVNTSVVCREHQPPTAYEERTQFNHKALPLRSQVSAKSSKS